MQGWGEPSGVGVDFFISYAGADSMWAEWIAAELEAVGRKVRLQAWDAVAGENFVAWMDRQMTIAGRTVALYSRAYFDSSWCTVECTVALSRQRLLPAKVEQCDLPVTLQTIGYVSLFDVDEVTARDRLMRAVGARVTERRPKRGFPGAPRGSMPAGELPRAPFPGVLPQTWNVRSRHVWFVGRDKVLADLAERFRLADAGRAVSQVLVGNGGGGKTQLAVEYAYRFASRYSLVWWVDAAAMSSTVRSFDALADAVGLAEDPDRERRARRALGLLRDRRDWLVVFDNVENRRVLAGWWPAGGSGAILITGRSRALGEFGEMHGIGVFSPDESVLLLRRRAGHLSPGDARHVADGLGHLPLAVSQAAAYISTTGISAETYLSLLATAMPTALADSPADYPAGILGSVSAAVGRMERQDRAVVDVLRLAAFLAPAPLPAGVLARIAAVALPDQKPVVATALVLRALDTLALAQIADGTFELHRLTQAVLRDRLTAADQRRLTDQAQEILADAIPPGPDNPDAWPVCVALAPHLHALFGHLAGGGHPPFRIAMLATVNYLMRSGQYTAALHLAAAAVDRWTSLDGADHPDTLSAAHSQAAALRGLGRFPQAQVIDQDTYERRTRLFGPEHQETLRSADAVGIDLYGSGHRAEARDWHTRALNAARAALGRDAPQTLEIASNLAVGLHGLDDLSAARELDEDTLARRRAVLGESHWQTLSSARSLARDLRALGLHAQARELAQDTYVAAVSVLGADHPDTLLAASSLAVLHYALGDLAAARNLHEDSLARSRRVLGADHPHTLRIANSLGVDVFRLGDMQTAHDLHRDTLNRLRRILGPDHPESLHAAHNLARDLEGLGRGDEAAALLQDTLDCRIRTLGPGHPETRRTEQRLRRLRDGVVDE